MCQKCVRSIFFGTRRHAALVPLRGNCKSAKPAQRCCLQRANELLEVVQTSSIEPPHGMLAFPKSLCDCVTAGDLRLLTPAQLSASVCGDNGTPAPITSSA